MKVGVFVPAYNWQINVNLTTQLLNDNVSLANAGHMFNFWSMHSCDLNWSRNAALSKALNVGLDYLLMVDSDVFSEVAGGPLIRLLDTAEKYGGTITAACVTMRTLPPRANVWPCHPGEIFEADKVGAGMILIDLRQIRKWYGDYDGPCFWRTYEDPACAVQDVGQDIFFSYLVRERGGTIICDATIPTVHVDGCHRLAYDGEASPDAAVITAAASGA